jgi:hypothetical protein
LAAAALLVVSGCDEGDQKRMSPEPFYGGWLPCIDEECTVVGTSGIAFVEDNWFHGVTSVEDTPIEELAGAVTVAAKKEWSWHTEDDHIVIDLANPGGSLDDQNSSQYQRLWVRFLDETHLQVEMIRSDFYDMETKELVVTECHEGEQFDPSDAGVEDGGPSSTWTAEDCWSVLWAPRGRALRVLTPAEVEVLTYEPPDSDTGPASDE